MDNLELVAKGFKTIFEQYKNPYVEKIQKLEQELNRYKKAFDGDEKIARNILEELLKEHHNFEEPFNFYYLRILATKIYHDNDPNLYKGLVNKPAHYIYKSGFKAGFIFSIIHGIIILLFSFLYLAI